MTAHHTIAPSSVRLPRLDHDRFVLDNGLTVIVQTDRRAPMVATNLWYGVGSRDEPEGRTGFAHLFEHLFFHGSEHRERDWLSAMGEIGAIDVNGGTARDSTSYYQTVHLGALDHVLWMEADRMGRLLPALNETALRDEVKVVKNEKMQREGGPLGLLHETELRALYGRGHPYGHTVLGSNEDLDRATMETVADWYRSWYVPGNAALSLVGDISVREARDKVERAFGGIPPGAPVRRVMRAVPAAPQIQRMEYGARLPVAGYRRTWLTAPETERDAMLLVLVGALLTGDKRCGLVGSLVHEGDLAHDVKAAQSLHALCGEFSIGSQSGTDVATAKVAAAIDRELVRFLDRGPDEGELVRTRRSLSLGISSGIQDIAARADALSRGQMLFGRPDAELDALAAIAEATPAEVLGAARRWLAGPSFEMTIRPHRASFAETSPGTLAPMVIPLIVEPPLPVFPPVREGDLSNGMKLVLVSTEPEMKIGFCLMIDGGSAAEPAGQSGLTALALSLVGRETRGRDTEAMDAELHAIDGSITASLRNDNCVVTLNALTDAWEKGLELLFDVVRNPAFPAAEFDRIRDASVQGQVNAQYQAEARVARELERHVYGPDHPYADLGTPVSLAALTLEDVRRWHRSVVRPERMTLYAVGGVDLDALTTAVERLAGDWRGEGESRPLRRPPMAYVPGRHHIDVPDAGQTIISAALPIETSHEEDAALYFVREIFGGSPSGRLYRRLRRERGWTYSVGTTQVTAQAGRWLGFNIKVQADATVAAIADLVELVEDMRGRRQVTDAEVAELKTEVLRSLPAIWASNAAILSMVVEYGAEGRPLSAIGHMPQRIAAVTADQVRAAAARLMNPARLIIVTGGPGTIVTETA